MYFWRLPPAFSSRNFATDIKILNGWDEESIVEVLTKLGKSQEEADDIYALSGGRIRLAIWGTEAGGLLRIKDWFDFLVERFGQIVLALTKTDSFASAISSDRLRTRFLNYDGRGSSLLVVDSRYAMTKLKGWLDFDDFLSSTYGLKAQPEMIGLLQSGAEANVKLVKALRPSLIAPTFTGYPPRPTLPILMPPLFFPRSCENEA